MASQGPNAPGTGADDAAVGTRAWASPGNVTAEDGTLVTASSDFLNQTTHYLKATNYSFSIPSDATIDGIVVEIKKRYQNLSSGTNPILTDSAVRIVKDDGSIGTTDRSSASQWTTTLAFTTYGSPTDLWGETWTPANINDADFGAVISAVCANADGDDIFIRVDFIRITVYYTVPPAFPTLDTFTDTNGTLLSAHTPDAGPVWSGGDSAFVIQSNKLQRSTNTIVHAFFDSTKTDVKVTATFSVLENACSIMIRRVDTGNHWEFFYDFGVGWQLDKVTSSVDSFQGPSLPGDVGTVSLQAVGNVITATGPDGTQFSVTDSTHNTATGVGLILRGFASVASVVDNFISTFPEISTDVTSDAAVSATGTKDVSSTAAVSTPDQTDVTTAAAASTTNNTDVLSDSAISIQHQTDLISDAAVSTDLQTSVTSDASLSTTNQADATSNAATSVDVQVDVFSDASITNPAFVSLLTSAAITVELHEDVASSASVFVTSTVDVFSNASVFVFSERIGVRSTDISVNQLIEHEAPLTRIEITVQPLQ